MSSFRFKLIDLNRLQKTYPISNLESLSIVLSDKSLEMSYMMVDIAESDTVSFEFEKPFTGVPSIVANFVSLNSVVGNVSVYVESVTKSGGVIKTSAPTTGRVSLQAIYIPE